MGQSADEIREQIEQTRAEMSDTVDELAYKADVPARVRENVSGRIASVKGTIKGTIANAVGGASANVRDASSTFREKADDMQDQARRNASMAVENPLGLVLAAFGAGLVAGLVIPISRLENEQLGPVRDQLVNRAQSAASEAVEAGKSIVGETVANAAASATAKSQEIARHAMSGTSANE